MSTARRWGAASALGLASCALGLAACAASVAQGGAREGEGTAYVSPLPAGAYATASANASLASPSAPPSSTPSAVPVTPFAPSASAAPSSPPAPVASASALAPVAPTSEPPLLPTPSAAPSAAPAAPVGFARVPLRLRPAADARGADARLDLELRVDGGIYSHARLVAQLAPDGRVLAPDGRVLLRVGPDGVVSLGANVTRVRLDAAGDVTLPSGSTLRFDEQGVPYTALAGQAPQHGPFVLEGLRPAPEVRRTAGLLAIIAATLQLGR